MKKETGYIYTLSDPDTGLVRYVGQTNHIARRYYNHLCRSRSRTVKTHKEKWINLLLSQGSKPEMEVIWEGNPESLDKKEQEFILLFKSLGANLTNATSGGKTTRGYKHTEEFKQALSKRFKGRKVPFEINEDWKRKCREGGRVMIHSDESKRKLRESHLGKPSFWTNNRMPDKYRQDIKERGLACSRKVLAIKDGIETEYYAIIEAERKTGCDKKSISQVANGIYKQCKGYVFKFI